MKSLYTVFFISALSIIACTEIGVVGEDFLPTDIDIRIDTFYVNGAQATDIPTFSTSTIYLSAGAYNDALFGNYEVETYFLPRLGFPNIDTLDVDSLTMTLRLRVNPSLFYGDSTSSVRFGLYYITDDWRAGNMTHSKVLQTEAEPFVEFEYQGQQAITLQMPQDYIENFIEYESKPDSIRFEDYINNFPGVALKAIDPTNLIVPFYEDSLRFTVLDSPTDTLPSSVNGVFRAAYSAVQKSSPTTPDTVSTLRFDWSDAYSFPFFSRLGELGQFKLSAAFLQIDRADEVLEESLPENHVRPEVTTLRTFIKRPSEVPFSFQGSSPNFNINYIDTTGFYLYNVALINEWKNNFNLDTTQLFYVVPTIEVGILYNTAIFNEKSSNKQRPRMVLTRVEPIQEQNNGLGQ